MSEPPSGDALQLRSMIKQDGTLELSRREIEMLAIFARERGRIVSRRMLLAEVWGMKNAENINTRTVDMHIAWVSRSGNWCAWRLAISCLKKVKSLKVIRSLATRLFLAAKALPIWQPITTNIYMEKTIDIHRHGSLPGSLPGP